MPIKRGCETNFALLRTIRTESVRHAAKTHWQSNVISSAELHSSTDYGINIWCTVVAHYPSRKPEVRRVYSLSDILGAYLHLRARVYWFSDLSGAYLHVRARVQGRSDLSGAVQQINYVHNPVL